MAADDPDDLYGLPLEEFVAARDSLAKRLRAGGDRPAAEAVKGLAKPSAAAWAVNQAVRSQPRAARALWAAGDELVATQERLLAGKADRDALRAATAAQREALAPLLDAARGLLTGGGAPVSETALARVEESLHAAALDPDVRGDVEAGRLTKGLRHVGMGTFAAAAPSTARGSRSKRAAAGGTKAGEGKRSGHGAGAAGAASAGAAGGATAAGEGKRTSGPASDPGEAKRAGTARRGRPAGDATGAAGQAKRGRSSAEREADERRAARAAAKQRVEAARGERAAARDALKAAREESREADAQAKAAVRAADAARRDADRATAGAQEAAEREQAAHDGLDAAEAALRSAREAS